MTATPLSLTVIDRSGSAAPPAEVAMDATNGNVLNNNSGVQWLEITNGAGTTSTVTVAQPNMQDGVASPGKVYSIPTTQKRRIGPFPVGIYGQNVLVTASVNTVTARAYQLGY